MKKNNWMERARRMSEAADEVAAKTVENMPELQERPGAKYIAPMLKMFAASKLTDEREQAYLVTDAASNLLDIFGVDWRGIAEKVRRADFANLPHEFKPAEIDNAQDADPRAWPCHLCGRELDAPIHKGAA